VAKLRKIRTPVAAAMNFMLEFSLETHAVADRIANITDGELRRRIDAASREIETANKQALALLEAIGLTPNLLRRRPSYDPDRSRFEGLMQRVGASTEQYDLLTRILHARLALKDPKGISFFVIRRFDHGSERVAQERLNRQYPD